jgi:transposase InsO family protein
MPSACIGCIARRTCNRAARRVKAKLREDRRPATRSNETWAMHFVHDQLATGTKLRVLTIIDTFSRFSPAIEPRFNFRGADVVEVLERVGRETGLPCGGLPVTSDDCLFVVRLLLVRRASTSTAAPPPTSSAASGAFGLRKNFAKLSGTYLTNLWERSIS